MYAQQRGIWWNVRGSGAGSIVAYAIGITNLDPLRNKLIFERFLNPGRVTMPDFDLDFPDDQREELIRYTVDKYGSDQVAQIVTFGRMKARAAVRDVGRAMDVPLPEVDRIAKMIPAIPGKPVTIKDVLTEGHEFYSADLRDLYEGQDYVKSLLDSASQLEGVARHSRSMPPPSSWPTNRWSTTAPLMRPPKSAVTDKITQYEFPILESIGLLKIDFLGLATLTLMREATRLIKERHGIEYTLDNLPIDDPKIYELLTSGDVMGVFQVEGQGMRRVLMDLRPTEFEHIMATISLYRPGPMEFIPDYIAVLHGRKEAAVRPSESGADPGRDDGRLRLPGAGDPDPDRHRGLHRRRGRPGAARHQQEEEVRAGRASRDLRQGRGREVGPQPAGSRRDLGRADGLCALRLQPRPRRRLRRDRGPDRLTSRRTIRPSIWRRC